LELGVDRDGEMLNLEIESREFIAALPKLEPMLEASAESKVIDLEVAGSSNVCFAVVPQNKSETEQAMPLLVWLPPPGPVAQDDLVARIESLCLKWNVIVLVPQSLDPESWMPDDIETIASSITKLSGKASVDESRVGIAGKGSGGEMALLTGFSQRSRFGGVGMIDGELTARLPSFENLPSQPMQIVVFSKSGLDAAGELALEGFEKAGFPVAVNPDAIGGEMESLFRWAWFLNRL